MKTLTRFTTLFWVGILALGTAGCEEVIEEIIDPYSYVSVINRSDSPVVEVVWRFTDSPPNQWQPGLTAGQTIPAGLGRAFQVECSKTCLINVRVTNAGGLVREWAGTTIQRGWEHDLIFQ
jgi:hypothetical protein